MLKREHKLLIKYIKLFMKKRSASLATLGAIAAFALTASLASAQSNGTNSNGSANNNSMYTLPSSGSTGASNSNSTTNGSTGSSGTGLTGSSNSGTNGTGSTGTSSSGTNGTGSTGTSTSNPGLPNTGAGGDAMRNVMLALSSTVIAKITKLLFLFIFIKKLKNKYLSEVFVFSIHMKINQYKNTIVVYIFALITAGAIIMLFVTINRAVFSSDVSETSDSQIVVATTTSQVTTVSSTTVSLPERLIIPSLTIDAKIQYVGISKKGTMAVPTNYTDVGWYRYGTRPGAKGNAVIDGHVDNGFGLAGVFKNLKNIAIGDEIDVKSTDGTLYKFLVTAISHYPYNGATPPDLFSSSNAMRLNLITCTGTWVQSAKTYTERLIITAEMK